MKHLRNSSDLRQAIAPATAPATPATPVVQTDKQRACQCALGPCSGWENLAEYRWDKTQMHAVGTLRDPNVPEPTLAEHHPDGTRYDSPHAPVATAFFPFNQCEVWHCQRCDRHLLRYTEFGGYNVDPRVRHLDPRLIVD